nr:MAG TPA: hypothetical protein [Bacteriophage sp.]
MTKINKQALKAYFQTGKIPTQSNFADLIDSVMNIPDGGWDSTLVLGNGDKNGAPYVNGYRFINNRDSNTYLIISCWDNALGDNVPVLLFYFPTNSPSTNSNIITYHVLTTSEVMDMYQELGGMFNGASDDEVVAAINYLALDWFEIFNRYNNNPPAPRVIQNGISTYFAYPCKQNNEWYVGYIVEDEVDMGGSNQLYRLTPRGNSQTKWNISDGAIITDLSNQSKWTRKIM